MYARIGRLLPPLRAVGVLVAIGVALIPSLEIAVAASLVAFVIAWIIATAFILVQWSQLPQTIKVLHLGVTLTVVATVMRLLEAALSDGQLSFPSWADAIAVPSILIVVGVVWQAARARAAMQELADVLDAVAVAVLPIGIVAALSIGYLADGSIPVLERLLNGGLFVVDAGFLVAMAVLIFGPGFRDRAAVWLAVGGISVVVFDLLIFVGIALEASWRDQTLRALAFAITCYAVATSYPSYISFAQPGTREQRYRSGVYLVGGLGLVLLLAAAATDPLQVRLALIATTGVFLIVAAARISHSTLTAQRLNEIADAESALARELADADSAQDAIAAATAICRRLLGSEAVTVTLEQPQGPIVASTDRVWVASWTPPPPHLIVTYTQMVHVIDFALDSITARNRRARELATVEATTDPVTGWRTQASFSDQPWVKGLLAVIECPEVESLTKTVSKEAGDNLLAFLAEQLDQLNAQFSNDESRLGLWRGEGATMVATTDIAATLELAHRHLAGVSTASLTSPVTPTITMGAVELEDPTDPTIGLIRAKMALDNGQQGEVNWFTDELQAQAERHWAILSCFKRSLADPAGSGFCCHYQGIVDSETGQPVALEALVRWIHPSLGPISPGEFIPIAEQEGLVDALDRWVLDTALRDLDEFRAIVPTLKMHVNMSPAGAISQKLETLAHSIRLQHADKATALVVELTETAIDERQDNNLAGACRRLRSTGAGLALDDFGTGQSNLARITRLPFTEIKLGADFARSQDSARMLATMVPTIKALGLPLVAENVETEEERDRIRSAGVDYIQGYLFSKPSPLPETLSWLKKQSAPAETVLRIN